MLALNVNGNESRCYVRCCADKVDSVNDVYQTRQDRTLQPRSQAVDGSVRSTLLVLLKSEVDYPHERTHGPSVHLNLDRARALSLDAQNQSVHLHPRKSTHNHDHHRNTSLPLTVTATATMSSSTALITDPLLLTVLSAAAESRRQCLSMLDFISQNGANSYSESDDQLATEQKNLASRLAILRGLNRKAVMSVRSTKQETTEARQEIDELHLSLQNLYYEQRHLKGEIIGCEEYE